MNTGIKHQALANSHQLKVVASAVCAMLLALIVPASAQQPAKGPRIGYLSGSSPSADAPRHHALRQGLRDLGYVEGSTIAIEWRFAEGKLNRLLALAGDLVRLNVDVIVTGGSGATRIGREATSTIPIVMAQDSDPVGDGFIATLARPGENITGLTNVSSEVSGKRLELLRDTIPKLFRVAVLGNSTNPANAQALKETENAAQALGLKLEYLDMQKADDAESVFNAVGKTQSQALLVLQNPIAGIHEHESYSLRQNVDFP